MPNRAWACLQIVCEQRGDGLVFLSQKKFIFPTADQPVFQLCFLGKRPGLESDVYRDVHLISFQSPRMTVEADPVLTFLVGTLVEYVS